jgi:hypothetical protein
LLPSINPQEQAMAYLTWQAQAAAEDIKQFGEPCTIDPAERLIEALGDEDGFFEADAGEYGSEAQDIGNVLAMAVERRAYGQGASDADILAALFRAADKLMRNRPQSYYEKLDAKREVYRLPNIQPALDGLTIRGVAK